MSSTTQQPWLRLLFGFGPIVVFGGALFLLEGAWHAWRDYIQRTDWPAVMARVDDCSIYETWGYAGSPSTKSSWSKSSYVRCRLRYRVGDSECRGVAKVGDAVSTYGTHSLFFAQLTIPKMHQWIADHHPGSFLLVHYDPLNPNNLSLAGEDADLKRTTPVECLWFGLFACTGGLVILQLASRSRNRQ